MGTENAILENIRGTQSRGTNNRGADRNYINSYVIEIFDDIVSKGKELVDQGITANDAILSAQNEVNKITATKRNKQLNYLNYLKRKRPRTYNRILNGIRAGYYPELKIIVSLQLIKNISWKDKQLKKQMRLIINLLEKMYIQKRIIIKKMKTGLAITYADFPEHIVGKGTASRIDINSSIVTSPEELAAILAHEGLHAYRMDKGRVNLILLESETDAHIIEAEVWALLRDEKYLSTSEASDQDNLLVNLKPKNRSEMRKEVGATYAKRLTDTSMYKPKENYKRKIIKHQKSAENILVTLLDEIASLKNIEQQSVAMKAFTFSQHGNLFQACMNLDSSPYYSFHNNSTQSIYIMLRETLNVRNN